MLSGCIVPPDSKKTELRSGNQEASSSAGKNTRIVLVPCRAWKSRMEVAHGSVSLHLFLVMWIFLRSLGDICNEMSSQLRSSKFLQVLVSHKLAAELSVFDLLLTQ